LTHLAAKQTILSSKSITLHPSLEIETENWQHLHNGNIAPASTHPTTALRKTHLATAAFASAQRNQLYLQEPLACHHALKISCLSYLRADLSVD
jgi:hypothetical protein